MTKRYRGRLGLIVLFSFAIGFASAMAMAPQEGAADLRLGITAAMTSAKVIPCPRSDHMGCFRIFFEVRSSDNRIHNIAQNFENGKYYLSQSFAYLSEGGVCNAYADPYLPRVKNWSDGSITLPSDPVTVSAQQPFAFPVTFMCDQPVQSGDTAQVQITVGVGLRSFGGGKYEDAKAVHLKWPQVKIVARTID